ncbi:hypothetical protein ACSBR2_034787 [Camellia fascicularis]
MGMFFNQMGFTTSAHVDPIGRSGGIWMLWNLNSISVRVAEASSQLITAKIVTQKYPEWILSAVYASPVSSKRKELWERLESITQSTSEPWMVAGDFNDFASQEEKRSLAGNPHSSQDRRRTKTFADRMNRCSIMDLGCSGPKLTWTNNRKGWANTMVRLDRAMCNSEWRTSFLEGLVRNLPHTYSKHSPLMVFTQGKSPFNPSCKLFKFEAAWISREEFQAVVEDNWMNNQDSLLANLDNLAHKASLWNKEVFGNIFRRKRWLLRRIEDIQKSQATIYSHNLHVLEMDLVDQYNRVLYQEELFWFQKSRSKWITQGDRNTKFFHLLTLTKKRKRKIDMLRGEDGVWVERSADLKLMVANYFINLFSLRSNHTLSHWNNLASHTLSNEDNSELMINLGVTLMHGRVTRGHFNHILERMQKSLAGWKTKVLSLATRTTLIQAVSSAIPAYTMQTNALPKKVCDEIDKLNRNFLWGDTPEKKKIHLVKWDKVCQSKNAGGLGIKKARDQNLALLTKLGWKLLNKKDSLWCTVLRCKYLRNFQFSTWPKGKCASFVWRNILQTRHTLRKLVKWKLGNGALVNIWKDWWCGDQSFADVMPNTHQSNQTTTEDSSSVAEFVTDHGEWDVVRLSLLFPPNITSIILNTPPPSNNNPDSPNWKGTQCDEFLVASAYELIIGTPRKATYKPSENEKGSHPTCSSCCGLEDLQHMFRDCYKAKEMWLALCSRQWHLRMIRLNWQDWLFSNSKNKHLFNTHATWSTVFIVTLWRIWKNRNSVIFDDVSPLPQESTKFIFDYSKDIDLAFNVSITHPRPVLRLINWVLPPAGKIKLNIDASKTVGVGGGFGGVFRDERDSWICGYYGKMDSGTSLETELWALYKGLTVLLQQGMHGVIIESNAQQVVQLMGEDTPDKFPFKGLLEDAKIIFRDVNAPSNMCSRKGTCVQML